MLLVCALSQNLQNAQNAASSILFHHAALLKRKRNHRIAVVQFRDSFHSNLIHYSILSHCLKGNYTCCRIIATTLTQLQLNLAHRKDSSTIRFNIPVFAASAASA